jgi:signal transduction histidine kinase
VVTRAEDPEYEAELRALHERVPGVSAASHPLLRVIADGEVFVASPLAPDSVQMTGGDGHGPLPGTAWTSVMILPLVARGRTVGAMALGTLGDRRLFDEQDLQLARELAQRAAVAVDTARLFAEAQAMRAEAEAANHAKAEFLATISHELRTPLTAIRGFTELVLEGVGGPLSTEQEDHLRRVSAASDHLLVLVDEVLGFARLQAGRAEVRVRPCMLDEIVDGALNLVRPMLDRKPLVLERRTPPSELRMLTDVDKVRQILANLLSNAVKFTERGTVTLEATGDENLVQFIVRDTGPGIAASALDSIFEPFRQVDQSLTRRVGGAGLGLAVARRLAELLGGSLGVESTIGAGSVFIVRLPRRYSPAHL